jgi:ERCC4-type nuclease
MADEAIMTEQKQEQRPRMKVVDSNEPGVMRQKLLELGWEQRRMEAADYWWFDHDYKKVGVERKEVNDFMASLGDRLANQLEGALDHFDTVILLLEGNWRNIGYNNLIGSQGISYNTWAMAWNFIRSQQHKGVTIELTTSMGHTVQRLNELYAWYQKTTHTGGMSHKTFSDDRIMAFPRGCRGKTAEAVLGVFKSLVGVGNADVSDLMNVPGIGEKKAADIYAHFNRGVSNIPKEQIIVPITQQVEVEQGRML